MATQKTYIETVGRRKTATARVRISSAKERAVTVNGKDLSVYFPTAVQREAVLAPLGEGENALQYVVSAHVRGGGLSAQAEAIRHGIARALVSESSERRTPLKKAGFLKRDPRAKERRKFGLKKARKRAQWSKR